MKKMTTETATLYNPPAHHGCTCMRFHGKEETGASKFWIGQSIFLPGGGADYAYNDNPLEKVYYVIEGEMTVTDDAGTEYVIHQDECISFPPFEGRYLENKSRKPARMLVIINYPEQA